MCKCKYDLSDIIAILRSINFSAINAPASKVYSLIHCAIEHSKIQ